MAVLLGDNGLPLKDTNGQDIPDKEARSRWWNWHKAAEQWRREYGMTVVVVRPNTAQLETRGDGYRPWVNALSVKTIADMLGDLPDIKAGEARWAPLKEWMEALLAGQFAEGATGDSEVVRLRDIAGHAITVMRAWSMNDKSKSEARQAAADDLWAKLHPDSLKITPGEIISAPGGPFELEKGETPHAP